MKTLLTSLALSLATVASVSYAQPTLSLRPAGVPVLHIAAPRDSSDAMTAFIPPDERAEATLTVENERNVPVIIYAEEGDFDHELGRIGAHDESTLVLPAWLSGPGQGVRLFVHPVNGFDLASGPLDIERGEHIGIRVPPR
jgi:hypothetical protein